VAAGRSSELIRKVAAANSSQDKGSLHFNITIEKISVSRRVLRRAALTRERPIRQWHVRQEDSVMLLGLGFNQCCEVVGRASAIIALAGMASLVFSATAIDILRLPSGH
jgi:hypothetical protein